MPEERALRRKLVICKVGLLMRKDRDLSERELIELVKKGSREARRHCYVFPVLCQKKAKKDYREISGLCLEV